MSRASLTRAAVVGVAGPVLEPAERELLPAGAILFQCDLPSATTADHVDTALDPAGPGTTSRRVSAGTIRGALGVQGILLFDDLATQAPSRGRLANSRAVLPSVPVWGERRLASLPAGAMA